MNPAVRPLDTFAAAKMIGISPTTLRIWRCEGKGPKFMKLGRARQSGVIYYEADVLAWIEERKFPSTSAYSPHGRASTKPINRCSSEVTA